MSARPARRRPGSSHICAGGLLAGVAALAGALASPPTEEMRAVADGRLLFEIFCVGCHGAEARGDGPMTEWLRVPPPDLTRIRVRRGGTWPHEELRRKIDGRDAVRAHEYRRMPIWGLNFQQFDQDTDQERVVRERIARLIAYLETIQVDPSADPNP